MRLRKKDIIIGELKRPARVYQDLCVRQKCGHIVYAAENPINTSVNTKSHQTAQNPVSCQGAGDFLIPTMFLLYCYFPIEG